VSWVAMTARGDLVASCDERGLTLVADATTGAVKARLDDGEIVLRTIAFDPGGGRVYTAGDDAQLREWDVATRRLVKKTPLPGGCRSIALSARGDRLIAACGGEAAILDLASGARVASCPSDRQVAAVALAPDGAFAAVATTKGDVIIWDTVRNVQTSSPAHRLPVQQVLFSSDATQVFSTSFDRRLRVWKGFPGESTFDEIWLQSSGDTPNSFALSADGKTLLVATLRGVVLRFEAR
jgi:WD40 repeat protein